MLASNSTNLGHNLGFPNPKILNKERNIEKMLEILKNKNSIKGQLWTG